MRRSSCVVVCVISSACVSQLEQPLLLYRNNSYLAGETEGSLAAILIISDGLLLGQGGSEDNAVITSKSDDRDSGAIFYL